MPFQKVEFEFPDPEKAELADQGVTETENRHVLHADSNR